MKIAFFSEIRFASKVPRYHKNMRVEFAQMCALEADHYPMLDIINVKEQYDVAILLVGKAAPFREHISNIDVVNEARKFSKKFYGCKKDHIGYFRICHWNTNFGTITFL